MAKPSHCCGRLATAPAGSPAGGSAPAVTGATAGTAARICPVSAPWAGEATSTLAPQSPTMYAASPGVRCQLTGV